MINKQGLLFLTLTSLILVLSVYYITMPNELLLKASSTTPNEDDIYINVSNTKRVDIERESLEEERVNKTKELNNELLKEELTMEEKNNIYEEIKEISKIESDEEKVEQMLKEKYSFDSLVKISDDVVDVLVDNSEHDVNLVVKMMSSIEDILGEGRYISISFKE